jgi:hypothetical protein
MSQTIPPTFTWNASSEGRGAMLSNLTLLFKVERTAGKTKGTTRRGSLGLREGYDDEERPDEESTR